MTADDEWKSAERYVRKSPSADAGDPPGAPFSAGSSLSTRFFVKTGKIFLTVAALTMIVTYT